MKRLFIILLILLNYIFLGFSSEYILYSDKKDNDSGNDKSVEKIYELNEKLEEIDLGLTKLEKSHDIDKISKIYSEDLKGQKYIDNINEIEMKLDSISKIQDGYQEVDIKKIKKKESMRINELELAIANLESKNLADPDEINKLKMKLKKRKERLQNINNQLEKLNLVKMKLTDRLDNLKEKSYMEYTVKRGDFLWKISNKDKFFGKGRLWPLIYRFNREKISNPDLIEIGWKLKIPIKTYRVGNEDKSLAQIAEKIYGDSEKWRWIYWANQKIIKDEDIIKEGWVLKIPLE